MYPMGTANGRYIFEFHSPAFQHFRQFFQIFQNYIRSLFYLYVQACVLHVGGCQTHMDILCVITNIFRNSG